MHGLWTVASEPITKGYFGLNGLSQLNIWCLILVGNDVNDASATYLLIFVLNIRHASCFKSCWSSSRRCVISIHSMSLRDPALKMFPEIYVLPGLLENIDLLLMTMDIWWITSGEGGILFTLSVIAVVGDRLEERRHNLCTGLHKYSGLFLLFFFNQILREMVLCLFRRRKKCIVQYIVQYSKR